MSESPSEARDSVRFIRHLKDSEKTVWLVARWLQSRGHRVTVPPVSTAETRLERQSHLDDGDLYISQRIEVKRRGFAFHNRREWPYPDFIVCARHSYDNATPKPYAYVVVSHDYSTAAFAMQADSDHWTKGRRKDGRYENLEQEFYFCPLDHVRFVTLPIITEKPQP